MTNADKYLKDDVAITKFIIDFRKWYYGEERIIRTADKDIEDFLREKAKPTLTEDERVILKNIDTRRYPTIKRTKIGEIIVISNAKCGDDIICYLYCYDHLFQFIKEGEEYEIKELLGDEE